MEAKLLITIDTEPDNQWDPHLRKNPRFENISKLDRLQKLFDRFNAKATYLTTYSVIKSSAINVLKGIAKTADCEIGTHLHAWETPPFKSQIKGSGSYLHQYPSGVQKEKLLNLDNLISETFRQKSVSYRGGRYSFDTTIVSLLMENGYLIDTSVTPGISWEDDGGPNFKKYNDKDYFLSFHGKEILEVPVSIKIKTKLSRLSKLIYLNTPNWMHAEGILKRLTQLNIFWLDPSFNDFTGMKWVCDTLLCEGARYLNIMFHSCVIIPGGSPYTMSPEATNNFFKRLESLLEYLLKFKKMQSVTLAKFYQYRQNNR